jgi:hypothetical protein
MAVEQCLLSMECWLIIFFLPQDLQMFAANSVEFISLLLRTSLPNWETNGLYLPWPHCWEDQEINIIAANKERVL